MSELIKSILVFQKVATNSTAPFCNLSTPRVNRGLPCYNNDDLPCTYCVFAAGQFIQLQVKAMERICEKPK